MSGPAFPSTNAVRMKGLMTSGHPGMTLRDYFAAKAMQGCLSLDDCKQRWPVSEIADFSYRMADSMLRQREAKQ